MIKSLKANAINSFYGVWSAVATSAIGSDPVVVDCCHKRYVLIGFA